MQVVLDIETEPFSRRFKKATSNTERRRLAPKPRLACACIAENEKKRYRYFVGRAVSEVIAILQGASEVITFNGERFDFLVLERHCGLKRNFAFRARCVDMYEVLSGLESRFRVSLDRASKLNLGVGKKIKGRVLAGAATDVQKKGARSDVDQTLLLYNLWRDGKLMYPARPEKDLPHQCPECGRQVELIPFLPDDTDMTEGQIFDYWFGHAAGAWGYARCTKCKRFFLWGV